MGFLYNKNVFFSIVSAMARGKNQLDSVPVQISTTHQVVDYLRQLVRTGFYGKNPTEAAERLLAATLEHMVQEGRLEKTPRQKS